METDKQNGKKTNPEIENSRVRLLPIIPHQRRQWIIQTRLRCERHEQESGRCVLLWSRQHKVQCLLLTVFIWTTTTSTICSNYQATQLWALESQNFVSSLTRKRPSEVGFQLVTIERPVYVIKWSFAVYFSWFSLCLFGSCFSYRRWNAALKTGFQTLFWREWIYATVGVFAGSSWWWCTE